MDIQLEILQEKDLDFVTNIYNFYTRNTTIVYFIKELTKADVRQFLPIGNATYKSYIVRNAQNEVCGFCYFSPFKSRPAFHVSVELTVYLHPDFTHKGYGQQIIEKIEKIISQDGFKNIIALVSADNIPSCRFFEKNNYQCTGELKHIAEKFGMPLSLKYYQKEL